jgi:hypothetical protein
MKAFSDIIKSEALSTHNELLKNALEGEGKWTKKRICCIRRIGKQLDIINTDKYKH